MAQATSETVVNLTLSKEEAQFLEYLLGKFVIGDLENSARKYNNSIYAALKELGTPKAGFTTADDRPLSITSNLNAMTGKAHD